MILPYDNGLPAECLPVARPFYSILITSAKAVLWSACKLKLISDFFIDCQGDWYGSLAEARAPKYDDPASKLPVFAVWRNQDTGRTLFIKLWEMTAIMDLWRR